MRNIILMVLLSVIAGAAQAQIMTVHNHTSCPVNVYPFDGNKNTCYPLVCGVHTPYIAGAYSTLTINITSMPCSYGKDWVYAALNTNPNKMGYADGCEVGENVYDGNLNSCSTIYSGSFYVVSCGSFVNVTWMSKVPTPGDVTIDIN
ncbi:MAG: hypothetical protein JST27_09220 [Bacteroidetes bacterium]|nr:hypothetical protein [Bacteroidota bacterium]